MLATASPKSHTGHCLRRSPRFSTPLLVVEKDAMKKTLKRCAQRSSQSCKESEMKATAPPKSHTGLCLRRSPRFSIKDPTSVCNAELNTPLDNQSLGDRRKGSIIKAGENNCSYKLEKRLIRGSCKKKGDDSEGTSLASSADKCIDERKKGPGEENKRKGKCPVSLADVETGQMMDKDTNIEVRKTIGVKRKRNEVKESHGVIESWTDDQEQALQKAYFAMKPTPHFWKKVAKLVVGKSAQDCFDKVQADHFTPLPRPKRQLRIINPAKTPSLPITTSSFLSPVGKKPRKSIIKKNNAQKEVRKLLQQHRLEDQKNETDLFSVLEGSAVAKSLKQDCVDELIPQTLAFDEYVSPLGGDSAASLVSPPVLKQVKNKALHEKYIDKLHQREAKRRAADKFSKKSCFKRKEESGVIVQVMDAVKTAKDALVLGVQDVVMEMKKLDFDDEDDDDNIDDGLDREEDEDDEL
ncbi:uncharacterized protein LOC124937510 isoform X2 [Impatiens glandulifera]|nr:uncharacterized protein LOC124937510 isoform X2 [Impatiens glandulifera]